MELRKDPITMSWVILEDSEEPVHQGEPCPLCPGQEARTPQTIYRYPYENPNWQIRVVPHVRPLYQIEGDAMRRAEGLYDKMRNLGAHEIVVLGPDHNTPFTQLSDEQVAQGLQAYVSRITDLKRDRRFRYITVFRNQGRGAGQDLEHPYSEITATPFIPRRVAYELRSAERYFRLKERCLICDILKQELTQQLRTVEYDSQFAAFCPFASRVPYETWVLPINHSCAFEDDLTAWDRQLQFGRFLKLVLQRIESFTDTYHLVLHSAPNMSARFERTGNWQTLTDDYHWHIEILPVVASQSKSYSLKEVYYNSLPPETAARELREAVIPLLVPHR
ncbi:MAG: galactose-1-phosphate uridylyltransferase [Terriglobia bacterium]